MFEQAKEQFGDEVDHMLGTLESRIRERKAADQREEKKIKDHAEEQIGKLSKAVLEGKRFLDKQDFKKLTSKQIQAVLAPELLGKSILSGVQSVNDLVEVLTDERSNSIGFFSKKIWVSDMSDYVSWRVRNAKRRDKSDLLEKIKNFKESGEFETNAGLAAAAPIDKEKPHSVSWDDDEDVNGIPDHIDALGNKIPGLALPPVPRPIKKSPEPTPPAQDPTQPGPRDPEPPLDPEEKEVDFDNKYERQKIITNLTKIKTERFDNPSLQARPRDPEREWLNPIIEHIQDAVLLKAVVENWTEKYLYKKYADILDALFSDAYEYTGRLRRWRNTLTNWGDWLAKYQDRQPGRPENKSLQSRNVKPNEIGRILPKLEKIDRQLYKEIIEEKSRFDSLDPKRVEFTTQKALVYLRLYTIHWGIVNNWTEKQIVDDYRKGATKLLKACVID